MKRAKTLKWLIILACLLAAVCAFTLAANAEIVDSGTCGVVDEANGLDGSNLTWTLDDAGTLTVSGKGAMKDYSSNSYWNSSTRSYDECTTAPWGLSFANVQRVKTVVIGNGVTSIGALAFYGCTGLTSVTIPDSVTSIGELAFYRCTGLTSVTIPNNVTSIGSEAFYYCTGLESLTIPDRVTSIGKNAFFNTAWFNNQPNGLVYAGKIAYQYKGTIPDNTAIVLKDGTKGIAASAFFGYKGLNSVTIPDSVTSIGSYAFDSCTSLASVTIPDSVTNIGIYAFASCTSLASVTIPDSVTSIVGGAFFNCTGLTEITIPDSVTSIGMWAFYGCTGLTSVTIPDGVTSIGERAFYGCAELTGVTIPDSVTSIESFTFSDCTNLASVTIPDSVTRIGYEAFSGCTSLASVTIGNSVTSIEKNAFSGCSAIEALTVGKPIEKMSVSEMTLPKENLRTVVITDGVTSMRMGAFSGCTGLTDITIPDSVTSIGYDAFFGCTGLTDITIPDSVTSIGYEAFSGCTGLKNITIPSNETYIGKDAFSGCTGLTIIIIPNGVTSIGERAFYDCTGLTSIAIPNSVTRIGNSAFSGCMKLTSVTIGNGVTSIGERAFSGCTALTSIAIPNSVTSIGDSAFSGCTGLTSVTISESVTNIGDAAFRGCSGLIVYYGGSEEQWKKINIDSGNAPLRSEKIHYNSTNPNNPNTSESDKIYAVSFNPLSESETYQINGILEDYVIAVILNGSEVYVENITISGKVYNVKKDLISEEKAEQLKGKNVICNYDKQADRIIAISKCREFKDLNQTDISTINNENRISVKIENEYKWSSGKVRVAGGTREVSQIPFEIMISNSIPSNYFDLSDSCKNNSVFDISISSVSITGLENCGQIYLADNSFPKTAKLGDTIYLEGVITLPTDFWLGYEDSEKTITAEYVIQMNFGKEEKVFQTVVKNRDPKSQLQNENNLLTDAVNKLKRTGNNAISLVGLEADLGFSKKQIQYLEKLVLIELSLYTMPEESIKEYVNKKVLEKIFGAKSYIGVKTGKLTIVVPYENRTKQLDIVCDITDYSLNNRTFGNFTNLTYHAYNIKNGKREKEAFLDGTAGLYVSANVEAFAESATDLALSQIKSATKTALNGYEEVERILFGETALKILSAAGYDSALDFGWELYVNKCKELAFACPVDIYVYDQNNTLCGAIVNNEVTLDTSDDVDLKIMNDEKIVTLWEDGYYVKILANCKGTLNISVSEKGYTSGAVRTLNFENIPLSVGKLLKQGCGIGYYDDQSAFAVEELNGDKIEATSDTLSLQFEQVIGLHEHTYTTVVTLPATCGADGIKTFTCECGDSYTEEIPATGEHTFGEWTVTKEATVDVEGKETRTCSVCGEKETRAIPKAEPIEPEFTPGDVDGDGEITSADARLALRASVGLEDYAVGSAQYLACDVDGDGKVTSADARLILRASVGLEDASKFGKKA